METIAASETIDPNRLENEEKDRFIRELYALQCRIFKGVDEKSFSTYIFRPKALRTRIEIFRNEQKKLVGYHAIHLFEMKSIGADTTAVFRAEAGLLVPYRGMHSTLSLAFAEFFRYKCLHPSRKVYYIGTLVHPSSYHLVFRHCREMYPTYRCETPLTIVYFMRAVAKELGISPVCPDNPLIVRVGWRVKNDSLATEYWLHCDKPDVQFFLNSNPGYLEGEGLLTMIPVNWKNLLWLFIRRVTEIWRHKHKPKKSS